MANVAEAADDPDGAAAAIFPPPEDLAAVINLLPTPVMVRDLASDRIVLCNQAAADFFGRDRSELLGQQRASFTLSPRDQLFRDCHNRLFSQVMAGSHAASEDLLVPGNGTPESYQVTLYIVPSRNDVPVQVAMAIVDQTPRQRQIVETSVSDVSAGTIDERLRALVYNSPLIMALKDRQGRYEAVSAATVRMFNRPHADWIGRTDIDVVVDKQLGQQMHATDLEVMATGMAKSQEESWPLLPNRIFMSQRFPLLDRHGVVRGMAILIWETTDLRRAEHLAQVRADQLENFTYAAAHDLKEPLRTVSSYLSLLIDGFDNMDDQGRGNSLAPLRRFLDAAAASAERMQGLLNGLMDLAVASQQKPQLELNRLDLMVDQVSQDLDALMRSQGGRLTGPGLCQVAADPTLLRQILMNLVSNALKYAHPERAPAVQVSCTLLAGIHRIKVIDNGTGIPDGRYEQAFKMFERLHPRRDHNGHGLGLALCRTIAELHGGSLTAGPGPDGIGTCLTLDLPAPD